jgi:RNA recognition motif-containing protein
VVQVDLKFDYAFLDFDDSAAAKEAIERMDGQIVHGHTIRVEPTKGKPRVSSADMCYNCNRPRHFARDCRSRRQTTRRSEGCYECGRTGHIQRDVGMADGDADIRGLPPQAGAEPDGDPTLLSPLHPPDTGEEGHQDEPLAGLILGRPDVAEIGGTDVGCRRRLQ